MKPCRSLQIDLKNVVAGQRLAPRGSPLKGYPFFLTMMVEK